MLTEWRYSDFQCSKLALLRVTHDLYTIFFYNHVSPDQIGQALRALHSGMKNTVGGGMIVEKSKVRDMASHDVR